LAAGPSPDRACEVVGGAGCPRREHTRSKEPLEDKRKGAQGTSKSDQKREDDKGKEQKGKVS